MRDGYQGKRRALQNLAESSLSIVTPLNRYIGYENAAAVAKQALKEEKTIREVVIENGYVENGSPPRSNSMRLSTFLP